ncbi:EamA family transporter [Spirosoma utsteinense]|uniref:Drug/metabolite transporter (DMT)-like permease n=1 Tax=Spirosoma utsteinense TaxID=2585773 RepID=A0ABR6W6F5_9BACT|nr:EamA family transporter [Spirosoma utsteinense]MBC3787056.1 drug/metabolite transporter (DMT)-like permease [Spirosoma utsteinense]MBC3791395.1 drug/metabolite transporter (DMT)-like permease [Spirosoma utsteinense]
MALIILSLTTGAVLIRIVANPLSNVFQKQLTQRSAEPLFVISATYGFLGLACLVVWPQLRFEGLSIVFWQSILLAGLLAMVGNVFLVKALQIGDLSVLGPINAYKSIVGILIGIFLLNEVPGWWGLAGIVLIVGGSYLVVNQSDQHTGFSWALFQRPEIKLRLTALVFSAIDGAFLKKAILLSTPTIAFFYWCVFGFIFTLIWILLTMRRQWRHQTKLLVSHKFTFIGLLVAVGVTQMTSNLALAQLPVGYALALFQLSALISVLFGYQFFREQDIGRKLTGALIMTTGAILIALLG